MSRKPYDPRAHQARCDECPLNGHAVVPPEPPSSFESELDYMAKAISGDIVAIVGEAPGEEEERNGRPFCGRSGSELDMALKLAHLPRKKVWVSNTILCRPKNNDLKALLTKISSQNKAAAKEAKLKGEEPPIPILSPIDCCKPRLDAELAIFTKFITLGKTATHAVTGATAPIMAIRGGLMNLEGTERTHPRMVMPTVHPAFVLRQQRWIHVFRNDINKAARWFRGDAEWIPPETVLNPAPAVLREFLSQDRIFAFDLETDGIEALTAKIRCVGVGYKGKVLVCGFLGKDGETHFYDKSTEEEIKQILIEFFLDKTKVKSSWNGGMYDRLVLENQWGIVPTPNIDGLLLHKSAESELPHNLAYAVSLYAEAPSWKCYDGETEVLTDEGWTRFDELKRAVPVAQWHNGTVHFVKPSGYVDQPYKGVMWRLHNQAVDLLVSPDHKMIYRPLGYEKLKVCQVQDLPKTGALPHVGTYEGGLRQEDPAFIQLIVAFQADGSWAWSGGNTQERPAYLDFGFTKQRKIERLESILAALGMSYKKKRTGRVNPRTRIWVDSHPHVSRLWGLLGREKHFGPWLFHWNLESRLIFLDELPLWDGTKGHDHRNYDSVEETNTDWVQACAVITGRAARRSYYSKMWRVSLLQDRIRSRGWSKLSNLGREEIDYDGRIYCVSVPSGFLLVRRNGKVVVSGNTDREGNKLSTSSETDEQLAIYCGYDVSLTDTVIPPISAAVQLRDQVSVWKMDQKIQAACADMHTVGMFVDQEKRFAEEMKLLKRRYDLLHEIRSRLGKPAFNPGSVLQLRDVLFEEWKLTPPVDAEDAQTASGDPSTADLVLRALLTDQTVATAHRDIIKLVRYYRKVMKVLGTYVVKLRQSGQVIESDLGWDDDEDWVDVETRKRYGLAKQGIVDPRTGRMHPGYGLFPVTGRLSSGKPFNAQNVPTPLRSMIVAAPGNVLVGADCDQLEVRIAAALWGVERYLQAFREGKDPHSMTAFMIFGEHFCKLAGIDSAMFDLPGKLAGKAYDDKGKFIGKGEVKEIRSLSKNVHFASQYMAGPEQVTDMIRATEVPAKDENGKERDDGTTDLPYALLELRKVREMREKWLKGAPQYDVGWHREINEWKRQRFLVDPVHGRRRDFLDSLERENPCELVNYKVQSAAASLMNNTLARLHSEIPAHKWGPGTGIIGQVHDWIGVECPESKAQWVKGLLEECMNVSEPTLPGVKFTATADIGHSWKEI